MVERVEVGRKHQVVIPEGVRHRLKLRPGSQLVVEIRDGYLALIPESDDPAARLRGLHREVWEGVEATDYVRGEREAWRS